MAFVLIGVEYREDPTPNRLLWWDSEEEADDQNALYESPADDYEDRTLLTGTDVSDISFEIPRLEVDEALPDPYERVDLLGKLIQSEAGIAPIA